MTHGWNESIEYVDGNGKRQRHTVHQMPLLQQLADAVSQPRAPHQSDGSKNANKSKSSEPGQFEAVYIRDDMQSALSNARALLIEYVGSPARYEEVWEAAIRLDASEIDTRLSSVIQELLGVLKSARIFLQYDVAKVELADFECESCGGTLVVARDVSSDVLCVGTVVTKGCGKKYRRFDFVKLLEGKKYLVDTPTAVLWTGRPAGTLYRWKSEGRTTGHGAGRPGQARWDLRELPQAVEGEPSPPPPPVLPTARTRAHARE